jgi:hypothetical protein
VDVEHRWCAQQLARSRNGGHRGDEVYGRVLAGLDPNSELV